MKTHAYGAAQLARVLQAVFQAQAYDAIARMSAGLSLPDPSQWVQAIANAARPILLEMYRQGMLASAARIANASQARPANVGFEGMRTYSPGNESIFGSKSIKVMPAVQKGAARWPVVKAIGDNRIDIAFGLQNPLVAMEVDKLILDFCKETNATIQGDLNQALDDIRTALRAGLMQGEAIAGLAQRLRKIISDPSRAMRIAATETSRAMNYGQLHAAQSSGLALSKAWRASGDACDRCLDLADMDPIPLDQPFYVDPKGGTYAIVMAPPLHPNCYCSLEEVLE